MKDKRQFSLSLLLLAVTVSTVACWLYVAWWQLFLLIAISLMPAIAVVLLINRIRAKSHFAHSIIWLLLFSCVFLMLYVLSAGPMVWVDVTYLTTKAGDSTPDWLVKFYEPIEIFNVPANPFRGTMASYFKAWDDYCGIYQAGGM